MISERHLSNSTSLIKTASLQIEIICQTSRMDNLAGTEGE